MIKWFFNDHIAHIFQVIASADMKERKPSYQAQLFLHFRFVHCSEKRGAVCDIK